MANILQPLQHDDNSDDDDLPPPIPVALLQMASTGSAMASAAPPSPSNAARTGNRKRATSWSAPAAPPLVPPPLPSAPLPFEPASLAASKLLKQSLETLSADRRPRAVSADIAFDQLVNAATEAKMGVGIRISATQPITCTAVIEGQSASHHPLSRRFVGCVLRSVDGADVASKTQDQVRDMILGPFGSVCTVQFTDPDGDALSVSLLRSNPEFFTSYEEQVKRVGSMVSPSLSAAIQAQNAALQQKVLTLRAELQEAEEKVAECARTLEKAHNSVKSQEDSLALTKILEEEEYLVEISALHARVDQLTREISLKDSVIGRHDMSVMSSPAHALAVDAAVHKAEVSRLEHKCAALEEQNAKTADAHQALLAEFTKLQQSAAAPQTSQDEHDASVGELINLLSEFEAKVPKLSSNVARLEAELQAERRQSSSLNADLEAALSKESSLNDKVLQLEEQLQHATSRALQVLDTGAAASPRDDAPDRLAGSEAWDAAVQRHAVSIVVGTMVERTVARADLRSLLERQQSADFRPRPIASAATFNAASQAGCSAGDMSNLAATVALDLYKCLEPMADVSGLRVPPAMCSEAVRAVLAALVTGDCSACTLVDVAAWCAQAAEKLRSSVLRAVAIEGERDGLLQFREQVQQDNATLLGQLQKLQQRNKEVEAAMLTSVNDVQQLEQQMGSLLTVIKEKSAENADLARQTSRLKQLLAVQDDLRQQIQGQKQQLLQYQLLERDALQLKMSRDDATQRVEQLEQELQASQDSRRQLESDLFRAREMLMDADLRMFSIGEEKARMQSERDSAEATLLAFKLLQPGGRVAAKPVSLSSSSSNRQPAPLPASLEFLAVDMKDSSAATLHQAQDVFDSLSSVAACGQLFSAALDLCERCILHTSEQGLRMSNELSALTDQANSLGYDQPADLFVRQLESNSDRAVLVAARMQEVMVAMKAQHIDLTSRYHAFVSQYTVFEHAVAEADKGAKHLQWLVKRRLMLHKEGRSVGDARGGCWVNGRLTPLQHASNDGDF